VFRGDEPLFKQRIRHPEEALAGFESLAAQREYRIGAVYEALEKSGVCSKTITAAVGPCGSLQAVGSGAYPMIQYIIDELVKPSAANHTAALGGLMAHEIAGKLGVPCYVVDPTHVDQLEEVAKLSGIPGADRRGVYHAPNQKAMARRCARELGMAYEDARLIVAHMGMTVTVAAHRYGRVIDVNNALAGDGPMAPRSPGGGMMDMLGTDNLSRAERMILDGDEYAALVFDAMAYQISKEIGGMFAALEGRADAIVLTGGMAGSSRMLAAIKRRVLSFAPVKAYPGDDEVNALAASVLRALRGEIGMQQY
jgi:butyrate kinase